MDKENGNRKRSTKGKVATERVQMGRSRGKKRKEKGRATWGIITGVKLGIQEQKEEEGTGKITYAWEGTSNRRIGERGARNWKEERGDGKRKSKDKVENAKGKKLVGGKEQRRKGVGHRNKTVDFYFFGIAVLCFKKMYPGI
jgi:hypothetical protein